MIYALPPADIQSVVSASEARAIAAREIQRITHTKVQMLVVGEKEVVHKKSGRTVTRVTMWDWNQQDPRRWTAWVAKSGEVVDLRDTTPNENWGKARTRHNGEQPLPYTPHPVGDGSALLMTDRWAVLEANNDFPFPDTQPVVNTMPGAGSTFGDGSPYEDREKPIEFPYPSMLRTPNALTPAGEASAYGQATLEFYRKFLDRDGPDGAGRPFVLLVHVGFQFNNAFYANGLCECFYFGDGDWFTGARYALTNTTAMDVVAHEMSHAVTYWTADLDYYSEAGGLNEASSDILGWSANQWLKSGKGDTIPTPTNKAEWTVGKDIYVVDGQAHPLRYMDRPSKDGSSFDYVDPARFDYEDPHFTSGPLNRWFYYMAKGVPTNAEDPEGSSPYVPSGYPYTIPIDRTVKIWYRALQWYLLPDADYRAAHEAAAQSARDLYGADSREVEAVNWTFAAIKATPTDSFAPMIASVYPTVVKPGDSITLSGAQFVGTPILYVGGVSWGNVTPANDRQIKVTVPPDAVGGVIELAGQYGKGKGPSLRIEVTPTINSFTVAPLKYNTGEPVTASWNVSGADTVKVNGLGVQPVANLTIPGIGPTATFTLEAIGRGGITVTQSITARLAGYDLNGDGVVDVYDAIELAKNWGRPGHTDLNGDGTTDAADLYILKGNIK